MNIFKIRGIILFFPYFVACKLLCKFLHRLTVSRVTVLCRASLPVHRDNDHGGIYAKHLFAEKTSTERRPQCQIGISTSTYVQTTSSAILVPCFNNFPLFASAD